MTTDRALYEKMYAAQLAEGHDLETAMRYNKAATPEDFLRAFGQSSDPRHQHRKWGGGNKMGSAGARINAERAAKAEAQKSAPDQNVNKYTNKNLADHLGLTALSNFVDSRVNDTQGKNMPSNPSFGFSQQTLNAANDGKGARGADPSFAGDIGASVYGGDMTGSTPSIGSYGSSFSNFTGGLPSLSNLSSFDSPSSFLNNMAMGSLIAGGIPYGTPGADDPFADHDDSPLDMDDDSDFPSDLFGIGDIRASIPRFAGIFAV